MNKGKNKMIEKILGHALEIITLVTGEDSLLKHLTNTLLMVEINKDKKKTERILSHALEIITVLTGEEYTVVKKNVLHSNIHQLTLKWDIEDQEIIMDENHQTPRTLEIQAHRSTGRHDENKDPICEGEGAIDEKNILQAAIHSSLCAGLHDENHHTVSINEDPGYKKDMDIQQVEVYSDRSAEYPIKNMSVFPTLKHEEQKVQGPDQIKKEDIPIKISNVRHDETHYAESINEEGTSETEEKDTQQVKGHSDQSTDGSLDSNATGENPKCLTKKNQRDKNRSGKKRSKSAKILAKDFECPDCRKCFSRNSHLLIHQRIHTGEKPFECCQCGKYFNQQSNLVLHQRVHTGAKPFSCVECGKRFTQNSHLINHQKIHVGEKPFACSECGKCFSQMSELAKHQIVHTVETPFACSDCNKCFCTKSGLVKHYRVHKGEKAFACSDCGKCFSWKSEMVTHQKIHTGEKPFVCSECGKCFSGKSNLVRHQKRHKGGKSLYMS